MSMRTNRTQISIETPTPVAGRFGAYSMLFAWNAAYEQGAYST